MTERIAPKTGLAPYFTCPCGDDHKFMTGHLATPSDAGPWFCGACGVGWRVFVTDAGTELADSGERKRVVEITLRIPPQTEDIVVTVEGMHIGKAASLDEEHESHHEYFYEEHTCPENVMRSVTSVRLGEESDPHGLFKYVSCGPPSED